MSSKDTLNLSKESGTPIAVGLLAHVDAGKTTLAEGMLYTAGKLRKFGRVDHKDAFLDTFELEKKRGITIFSKQAQLELEGRHITLLDTPGHVDFSPETERTLQVLDYAILVISASDGVQGHVLTLWRLLEAYKIPVFIFVNKMDQDGCEKAALLSGLKTALSSSCTDFSAEEHLFYEELATASDEALEQYLENGRVDGRTIREMILRRRIFPCFFGSALHLQGIEEFLSGLSEYLEAPVYPDEFGARVFKIARDEKGERLTYIKVTGGTLKVKTAVRDGEKINQIRIYDGAGYELVQEAKAGCICAATGLFTARCGDGLGICSGTNKARLVPVLTYSILPPEGCDTNRFLDCLKQLEEEEPQLNVVRKEETGEINVQVMGTVQIEILKSLIKDRFDMDVEFGAGSIIYKETIQNTVEGVGHFEPLRHYAEVHLLLESAPRGSGVILTADCREDMLDLNWQRLILTHLAEKRHCGVLTGAELTDIKITLKSGRAHTKHTEGGDFRQATYRAVRQGLMQAENILLEPYYSFRLEIPAEMTGRAMNDIQRMSGSFLPVQTDGAAAVITGSAPVSEMRGYPAEVVSYTRGRGRLYCEFSGYEICHNAQDVIFESGYDPERDTENPSSSVFCTHGSGYIVPWDKVPEHMHLESVLEKKAPAAAAEGSGPRRAQAAHDAYAGEKELKEIFERTYGSGTFSHSSSEYLYHGEKNKRKNSGDGSASSASSKAYGRKKEYVSAEPKDRYLFVDGYNIIFAWDELKSLAQANIDSARERLIEIMCNYQAYRGMTLILVFDAYKVKGGSGRTLRYHGIDVVYTKEGESADQYIEKRVSEAGKKYDVTVATSDRLEQISVFSHGARRMSAAELYTCIEEMSDELRRKYLENTPKTGNRLFADLTEETVKKLEEIRLKKNSPQLP